MVDAGPEPTYDKKIKYPPPTPGSPPVLNFPIQMAHCNRLGAAAFTYFKICIIITLLKHLHNHTHVLTGFAVCA